MSPKRTNYNNRGCGEVKPMDCLYDNDLVLVKEANKGNRSSFDLRFQKNFSDGALSKSGNMNEGMLIHR